MFTNIKLRNYKSLVNVEMDLLKSNEPKNIVLLYGENGAGKSNMASSVVTLLDTLRTLSTKDYVQKLIENNRTADMDPEEKADFLDLIAENFRDIEKIIKDCKTLGSEDNMYLEYSFKLKGAVGTYSIEMDDESVVSESLYYLIDKRRGFHFKLRKGEEAILNPNIFTNGNYYNELIDKIEKYWGKHSLLGIIENEYKNSNSEYLLNRVSSNLIEFIEFLHSLSCQIYIGDRGQRKCLAASHEMFFKLERGEVEESKSTDIKKIEEFLDVVFTSLYSDIKKVYYKCTKKEDKIRYELFFKKKIGDKLKDISFKMESRGTLKLLSLIPLIYEAVKGETVIIDEFDSGIHDLLIQKLILSISEYIKGQLIITTHNTILMESGIPNDSIYFLVVNELGDKQIACLTDYKSRRTHPNNNIRSLYMKGIYEAVPNMIEENLNFDELQEILGDD